MHEPSYHDSMKSDLQRNTYQKISNLIYAAGKKHQINLNDDVRREIMSYVDQDVPMLTPAWFAKKVVVKSRT